MALNSSKNSVKKRRPLKSSPVKILITISALVIAVVIMATNMHNEEVLVQIGSQIITEQQLDAEYNQLPEYFASKVNKSEFLETVMIPHTLLAEASRDQRFSG